MNAQPRILNIPREILIAITSMHPLRCAEGEYWEWRDGRWIALHDKPTVWFLRHLAGRQIYRIGRGGVMLDVDTSTPQFISPLERYIEIAPEIQDATYFRAPCRGITVTNGFLMLGDDGRPTLLPHSPEHRSRFFLDTIYDPTARCPYTMEILASYFTRDKDGDGEGKQRAILEFIAICLFSCAVANRRGVILWVTGEKGTGKSTLIEALVDAAFDRELIGNVAPHVFDDPTERFRLVGKLINFKDEIESRAVRDVGSAKALVSGSEVSVKKLCRDLMQARIACGHLFVANEMAVLADSSGALQDRVIRVHFTHPYDREFEDPRRISEKIKAERAGFLNLLAETYRGMLERGNGLPQVAVPVSALRRQQESALEADAIRQFIGECVVSDPDGRMRASQILQKGYNPWRIRMGIKRDADAAEIGCKLCEMMPEARSPKTTYESKTYYRVRLLDPDDA